MHMPFDHVSRLRLYDIVGQEKHGVVMVLLMAYGNQECFDIDIVNQWVRLENPTKKHKLISRERSHEYKEQ